MTALNPQLFKKYDIRGRAGGENPPLTPEVAQAVGRAFGTYLQRLEHKRQVVIGHDNRLTSEELAQAALTGLRSSGCDVTAIGLVSTPTLYWHAVDHDNAGGLMVTGSHLAPDQNGFKLSVGARNLYGDQIQILREMIEGQNYVIGSGNLTADSGAVMRYTADLISRAQMGRSLNVVLDPGNGTGGLFAPRLFEAWGHQVTCICCDLDGTYPNHHPNPEVAENVQMLSEKVLETGADIGIAFDGDADRMGAVDERGQLMTADRVLALLARDMLSRHPGASVVGDVLSSQVLFDEIAKCGGKPVLWASGHSLVKAKMAEIGALLGGEMSGHIFLAEDYFGYDDGFLAAGRLVGLLSQSDEKLSALDASLPKLYSTPEYRPHCPDEAKERVINGVKAALQNAGNIVDVDGVRIQFKNGWGLLRASNTEPVLSLRFEGQTEADALGYRDLFFDALRKYPEVEPLSFADR
jgi:phosphomannomutase / phosphoglucomutase